jgi:hypothetical protein
MNPLSRRTFITRGSIGVVLASGLAAVPGLSAVLKMPIRPMAAGAQPSMAGPLIAHVRDANTGEIVILFGTNKIVHTDADLAARLYGAAGRAK